MTERAQYCFKVKEFADGTPFIAMEPVHEDLSILSNRILLSFDLNKGTTFERAKQIAEFMDENISQVALTKIEDA